MKNVMILSSDMKMNNRILAFLRSQEEEIHHQLFDYVEQAEAAMESMNPDLLIVHDSAGSEQGGVISKEKRFVELMTTQKSERPITFITNMMLDHHLPRQLMASDFFRIIPSQKMEHLLTPPQNQEEVYYIFESEQNKPYDAIHVVNRNNTPAGSFNNNLHLPANESSLQQMENKQLSQEHEILQQHQTTDYQKNATHLRQNNDDSLQRSIVTVVWSPIPNVGVNTFMKALGYSLAERSKKVLLIELDTELAKLARTTSLTHSHRDLYQALSALETEKTFAIEDNMVNNELAIENLPFSYKEAKNRLKLLPNNLYVLSRDAVIGYRDDPDINNDRVIELMFYQAKKAGFDHILVDVPSSAENLFSTLSFLYADERLAVVDDSFATSGIYKNAMDALGAIDFEKEDFDLIINKYRDNDTLEQIAGFYEQQPVAALPYDEDLFHQHLDLKLQGGEAYMDVIYDLMQQRYGIEKPTVEKKKKKLSLFSNY
ncbi:AAA family ATPase [Salibacterium aidingense]|uniref:AAA family ATPase n=1 Tax=Salibacterium aidingense TaxID=384933 RepID=UPI00040986BA|nr:AAA family ATPase [Salibacterium aidingense]